MLKKIRSHFYLRRVSKKDDYTALCDGFGYDQKNNIFDFSFNRLFSAQIKALLKIVDNEVIESFHFGLEISREHLFKEKVAVLSVLNKMGNLHLIPENYEFEEAYKIFSQLLFELLEDETCFYFEKCKRENKTKNMYNCHLVAVASSTLRAIYKREIPFT